MTSDEKQKLLRVGIMGAARIARKNCLAINSSLISNCVVSAIASRDYAKGKQFVLDNLSDCNDSIHICKSYEDLITGDFCDAVYIPLVSILWNHLVYCIFCCISSNYLIEHC